MAVDLERTIDGGSRTPIQNSIDTDFTVDSISNSRVRAETQDSSVDRLKTLFDESTRQLLRERLIIASVILATNVRCRASAGLAEQHLFDDGDAGKDRGCSLSFWSCVATQATAGSVVKAAAVDGDFHCGRPFVGTIIRFSILKRIV